MLKTAKIIRLTPRERQQFGQEETVEELIVKTARENPGVLIAENDVAVRAEASICFVGAKMTPTGIISHQKARILRRASGRLGAEVVKVYDNETAYSHFCFFSKSALSNLTAEEQVELRLLKTQEYQNRMVIVGGHICNAGKDFGDSRLLAKSLRDKVRALDDVASMVIGALNEASLQKVKLLKKQTNLKLDSARRFLAEHNE